MGESNTFNKKSVVERNQPPDSADTLARIEQRKKRYALLKDAATAIELAQQLSPNDPIVKQATNYLEALKFYGRFADADTSTDLAWASETIKPTFLTRAHAHYTDAARNNRVEGTVLLIAVFTDEGEIKHIIALKSLSHGLTEEAIKALSQFKFRPAIKDGKPISVSMMIEFGFNLL